MKKYLLLVLCAFFLSACSSKYENLNSVKSVDLNRYMGTWYEIARYEHFFEKDCKNVTATYSIKENGKIKVVNKCTNINTNKAKEAIGQAYNTDNTNSKLKVSFFWPFYGNYWILDLADDYSYAIIGEPSREYFWILSRSKKLDEKTLNRILEALPSYGYNKEKLIWTIQE